MAVLELVPVIVGPWTLSVVRFAHGPNNLMVPVAGFVANAVPTSERGRQRLRDWKFLVAAAVRDRRGGSPWDAAAACAISIGFSFHPLSHGTAPLDVENFVKPTLDAVAAGLFSKDDGHSFAPMRYDFDDSQFSTLFFQRLPDAQTPAEEGAAVHVCGVRKGA